MTFCTAFAPAFLPPLERIPACDLRRGDTIITSTLTLIAFEDIINCHHFRDGVEVKVASLDIFEGDQGEGNTILTYQLTPDQTLTIISR